LAAGGPGGERFHNVVVAARAIEAGRPLEPDDLRVVPWPVAALPEGALENPDWLLTPPRVLVSAAAKGEPILRDRLAGGTGGLWLGAGGGAHAPASAAPGGGGLGGGPLRGPGAAR